jgi:hypothetical protein
MLQGVGYPTSIVLRCRVTPPFAELRQMLLVDAVDLGLHLGMPAVHPPAGQSETRRIGFPLLGAAGSQAGRSGRAPAVALKGEPCAIFAVKKFDEWNF